MKIVFDARRCSQTGSGVGNYSANLLEALLRVDTKLEIVLILRKKIVHPLANHKRVSFIYYDAPLNSPSTVFFLARKLNKLTYDLYHSPLPIAPLGLKQPHVVTVHDIMWMINPDLYSKNKLHRFLYRRFMIPNLNRNMKTASWILCVSESTKRALVEYMPWYNSKISVSYNGIDTRTIFVLKESKAEDLLNDVLPVNQRFVLIVSSNTPYKNRINAIKGFIQAFHDHPDMKLVIVQRFTRIDGDFKLLFRDPVVREKVIILPHVDVATLNALYNRAEVLLHPSYYEGFGIPLIEAMAVNTPVVTSTTSCLPEIVGDAALCVDPASPFAIGKALKEIVENPRLRAKLVRAGKKRAAFFTWDNCARASLEGYRNALDRSIL